MNLKRESGQALVLVLLSLSVVLTLILYILSRSVTDVAISSRQEEAVRAFSAAEAGIERSLITGVGYDTSQEIGNATYTTTVVDYASGDDEFQLPNPLSSGDTATIWFVSHDANGNLICDDEHYCFTGDSLEVCWGNTGTTPG
jgi:Tfp pilus assembly protein PilX